MNLKPTFITSCIVLSHSDWDIFELLLDIFKVRGGHFSTVDEVTSSCNLNIQYRDAWDGHTLKDIGYIFGVSKGMVHIIERKALRKLRHHCFKKKLKFTDLI